MNEVTASNPISPPASRAGRVLAAVAAAAALAFALSLAARPISNDDIGYHLAYGDRFWKSGEIVTDDSFVFPRATAADARPDDLPPGNYYDAAGHMRFVNANWLSQVIMSGAFRLGGWTGLNALAVALVAMVFLLQAGILRRLALPAVWLAPVWICTALAAYERFDLRPEVFEYVVNLTILWLLCGRITWPRVLAAAAAQVVGANVHSFWMLNLGIVLAFLFDAAARAAWSRLARRSPIRPELRRRLVRLAVCAALVLPAPILSPGTWRTLIFPVQTLQAIRHYHIGGNTPEELDRLFKAGKLHPWALIGEHYGAFTPGLKDTKATYALLLLLAAAAGAELLFLARRNWALACIVPAYVATTVAMRRNVGPAAMVLWPLIALAGHTALGRLREWRSRRREAGRDASAGPAETRAAPPPPAPNRAGRLGLPAAVSAAAMIVALLGLYSVVTNRFYAGEGREVRFGAGLSRLALPLDACAWLDRNLGSPQNVFADFNTSSNVVYFSRKAAAVPLLTNSWAETYSRMLQVISICGGWARDPIPPRWNMDVAVLRPLPGTYPLAHNLADPASGWRLVHVDPWHLVFLRQTPANAPLIAAQAVSPETFDANAFIQLCRQADPVAAFSLKVGAETLQGIGWFGRAEPVWRACLAENPTPQAWMNLGVCLAVQARAKARDNIPQCLRLLHEARQCFQTALLLKNDFPEARRNLQTVAEDLDLYGK